MIKIFVCALSLVLSVPAFGQGGPGSACGQDSSDFEVVLNEFLENWTADIDLCGFQRLTTLNEMIGDDIVANPGRYIQRMNLLESKKSKNPEAYGQLKLSFQEVWFYANIDMILMREDGRSSTFSRWLTGGAVVTGAGLMALPVTKRYSPKIIRLLKTGLKHFLQKRALTFGPASLASQLERFLPDQSGKKAKAYVPPPLYFGGDDEIMDERTYRIFVAEIGEDVAAGAAGVLGGWAVGHGASVLVRDRLAKDWASTALGRFKFAASRPATFASPGMITGFVVTLVGSNLISDYSSDLLFRRRFNGIRSKLKTDLQDLAAAVSKRQDFLIYKKGERLKNDLTLHNYILTRELVEGLGEEAENAAQSALSGFQYCTEPRENILARVKAGFFKDVAGLIKDHDTKLRAALILANDAQEILNSYPHRLTNMLTRANQKMSDNTVALLNAEATAGDLWADIEKAVKDKPVECVSMEFGMPL